MLILYTITSFNSIQTIKIGYHLTNSIVRFNFRMIQRSSEIEWLFLFLGCKNKLKYREASFFSSNSESNTELNIKFRKLILENAASFLLKTRTYNKINISILSNMSLLGLIFLVQWKFLAIDNLPEYQMTNL